MTDSSFALAMVALASVVVSALVLGLFSLARHGGGNGGAK